VTAGEVLKDLFAARRGPDVPKVARQLGESDKEEPMNMNTFTKDELLKALGLETRKAAADYVLPVLGVFGAGLIVGAGLGILFAPKTGHEIRSEIGDRMGRMGRRGEEEIPSTH
jgi:hypothetical protein